MAALVETGDMVPLIQQIRPQWATVLSNSFQNPTNFKKTQHAMGKLVQKVNS